MKGLISVCVAVSGLLIASAAAAQDVAITNARIIVGSGQVIESGTIVVRGGKIVSVTAGTAPTQGLQAIDAKGMSAMPGFIDSHKHVNNGENAAGQMRSLLEAGYTTVLAGGGQADANIALRDRIDKGEFIGPRIIASGQINLRQTPADARAAVQALAAKGLKHTGEIALTPEPGPTQAEIEVLKAILDEAKKVGVQVNVHAVSTAAMVAAIDAGITRLVHVPNKDWTGYDAAETCGADRLDRRRRRRVRRALHRQPVCGARAGAVAEGQQHALPRRQALARSDLRRQPRPEGARGRHRRRILDGQRAPDLGRRRDPSVDFLFDRSERCRPRRPRARAEVVQRHVFDGRYPQDHRPQRRALRRARRIRSERSSLASWPTSS